MTAEALLLLLLVSATALSGAAAALIVAALGPAGWVLVVFLGVTAALALRCAMDRLAARSSWMNDDLLDDWRAGSPRA